VVIVGSALVLASLDRPMFELKGFDEFSMSSISQGSVVLCRWVFWSTIAGALLPYRAIGRWIAALGVGLAVAPLIALVFDALSLAEAMSSGPGQDPLECLEPRAGLKLLVSGLGLCLVDAAWWGISSIRAGRKRVLEKDGAGDRRIPEV
jgi:hypothetical protein